jgi:hypothetical protein
MSGLSLLWAVKRTRTLLITLANSLRGPFFRAA